MRIRAAYELTYRATAVVAAFIALAAVSVSSVSATIMSGAARVGVAVQTTRSMPAETVAIGEEIVLSVAKIADDAITCTDGAEIVVAKPTADTITMADAPAKVTGKNTSDSVTLADSKVFAVTKAPTDIATISDAGFTASLHVGNMIDASMINQARVG